MSQKLGSFRKKHFTCNVMAAGYAAGETNFTAGSG
jgi:hypothetical protein